MNATQVVAWLRALAWVAIGVVGLLFVTRIHYTIVTFGLAAVASYMLYPCVNWLFTQSTAFTGRQLSWGMSVLVVYVTLPILLGVVLYFTVPAVSSQIQTIINNFPSQSHNLTEAVNYWTGRFKYRIPPEIQQRVQTIVTGWGNRIQEFVLNFFGYVANGIISILTWGLVLLFALIISQFMLLHLPDMRRNFYEAVPDRFRDEVREVMHEVNFVFGGFIKGTFILAVTASTLVFVLLSGLSILAWIGVPGFVPFEYSLILAILTLVLYPIPILGLVGIALVGALAAWFQAGGGHATYIVSVVSILVGSFTAVDRLVGPRVMSNAMGVSPLFVMFSAFAGAELIGFWGMVLGVPMAAALKVLFRYVRRRFLVPQEGDVHVGGGLLPFAPAQREKPFDAQGEGADPPIPTAEAPQELAEGARAGREPVRELPPKKVPAFQEIAPPTSETVDA
jgi:predicted PurR-regulated permease PerM